jgi:hypothetical protein
MDESWKEDLFFLWSVLITSYLLLDKVTYLINGDYGRVVIECWTGGYDALWLLELSRVRFADIIFSRYLCN